MQNSYSVAMLQDILPFFCLMASISGNTSKPSAFLLLKQHPRLTHAFFGLKLKFRVEYPSLSETRFDKHGLQQTNLRS